MAAFNFPNSPSTNDLHTENGVTYKWNGTVWKRQNASYTDATNLNVTGISTFSGDISIADKIIHAGDTNTAIRFPAADTITAETGGSERLRIKSGGNIGIGTNTATSKVEIFAPPLNATTVNTTTCKQLGLWITPAGTGNNTTGNIYNGIALSDGFAGLYGYDAGASAATGLGFFTGNASAVAERLRIASDGKITVAANSDIRFTNGTWTGEVAGKIQHNSNNLYIQGGTGGIRFRHASNGANHFSMTNGGNFEAATGDIVFGTANKGIHFPNSVSIKQNVSNLYANLASGNNNIEFQSNGTSFAKFRGTNGNLELVNGNLVISTAGKGIDFSAQTASSATGATTSDETLDHYEEGSWTPTFNSNSNGGTFPVSTYVRVGRLVSISFHATVGGGSDSSGFKVFGLPFSPDKNGVAPVSTNCNIPCHCRIFDSSDRMEVHKFDSSDVTYANLSDKFIMINATYRCNP